MFLTNGERLLFNLVFIRGVTDYQGLSGLIGLGGTVGHYNPYSRKSAELLPDFCASCLTDFGKTVSGRVRLGCPNCQTPYTTDSDLFKQMTVWQLITQDHTDYKLCLAYKEYMHE